MQKSKLIDKLRIVDRDEMRDLSKFVESPFFNKDEKVVKLFERNEKPQRCPAIVHSAYQKFKASKVFRGAERYDVDCATQISCCNDPFDVKFPGKIVNFSRTGYMAQIDNLGFVCTECSTSITFPLGQGITVDDMRVEHLWSSKKEGAQFHGFKFLDLDDHQE